MRTRTDMMAERLRELREAGEFGQTFDYAVYLAWSMIETERLFRRYEEAVTRHDGKVGRAAIMEDYLAHSLDRDEFFDKEEAFFREFIASAWEEGAP